MKIVSSRQLCAGQSDSLSSCRSPKLCGNIQSDEAGYLLRFRPGSGLLDIHYKTIICGKEMITLLFTRLE